MDEYLPENFREPRGVTPFCIYYALNNHPSCDAETNSAYTILFFTHASSFTTLDTFTSGWPDSNPGHCIIYPL